MKLKTIAAGALLAAASFSASAATVLATSPVLGSGFTDAVIGTITVSSLSDISGNIFAAQSINYGFGPLNLDQVTFTSASVGNLVDTDASATGFSFHNVAAGVYTIKASGSINLTPGAAVHNFGLLGANYNVTAVPEPTTYGMLVGGLALLGVVARRKAKKAA